MKNDKPAKQSDFLLFTSPEGDVNIEVSLKDETVWLTQKRIGELFGKERSVITKHLNNIFLQAVSWTKTAMCKKCTLVILLS